MAAVVATGPAEFDRLLTERDMSTLSIQVDGVPADWSLDDEERVELYRQQGQAEVSDLDRPAVI